MLVLHSGTDCGYSIPNSEFFSRIKIFTNWPFLDFEGTDCKEYLLKSKHFEGKIFTNCFQFVKFMKIFPHENNSLYGIVFNILLKILSHTKHRKSYYCYLHSFTDH